MNEVRREPNPSCPSIAVDRTFFISTNINYFFTKKNIVSARGEGGRTRRFSLPLTERGRLILIVRPAGDDTNNGPPSVSLGVRAPNPCPDGRKRAVRELRRKTVKGRNERGKSTTHGPAIVLADRRLTFRRERRPRVYISTVGVAFAITRRKRYLRPLDR